ncbi:MAG: hypothetical protein ACJ74Z_19545 [Bryobacteraceae bacterium]
MVRIPAAILQAGEIGIGNMAENHRGWWPAASKWKARASAFNVLQELLRGPTRALSIAGGRKIGA